ncbi:MAG: pyridoxal-dependent decarboxylase [Anaerolineales bacterium]
MDSLPLGSAPADGETLDPQDWESLRQLGHQMVDDMFEHMQTVRERPVWVKVPSKIQRGFQRPLPRDVEPPDDVYRDFRRAILPYSLGNLHPRFWGWVMGNGTPLGMLADMLASGLNPNMGGGDHVGNYVEHQVIAWCAEMFDWPTDSSGLLVSGGSVANLTGLAVARTAKAGFDVRALGLVGAERRMTMYGSAEMHSSLQKAAELLGLGDEALRRIPVDDQFHIDLDKLRGRIEADLSEGHQPIALIGCAGTTNTGALDPLDKLADIAEEYDLWYHIDGAFGALAYLAPDLRPRLNGLNRADSLAFDLHKWFYLPMEIGGVLIADEELHRRTFALQPDYLEHGDRGPSGGSLWYGDYGIQLTRGFRALKAWMAFRSYGVDKVGRVIDKNVRQAAYLAQLVDEHPFLERLAPVDLNIVCFRYLQPDLHVDDWDVINQELLYRLQETGAAVPSSTHIKDHFALRVNITNHRSQQRDFDQLVKDVVQLGDQIVTER